MKNSLLAGVQVENLVAVYFLQELAPPWGNWLERLREFPRETVDHADAIVQGKVKWRRPR